MPKYTFKCSKCDKSKQTITSVSVKEIDCDCGAKMSRKLPTLKSLTEVNEVIDNLTGTKWKPDQKQKYKERQAEYYWSVEVPRFVQSGTYSLETMLENGWVYLDDNGRICMHTKPPHKR